MKKYMHKIAAGLMMVSALTFTACDQDAEGALYAPQGVEAAFLTPRASAELDNSGQMTIEVNRGNLQGNATVKLTITDENKIFTLASENVTFEAGKNSALATVNYDYNKLEPGKLFSFAVSIANEEEASPNAYSSKEMIVQRKLTWKSIGTGKYYSNIFGQAWPQEILQSEDYPNIYRLPDCIEQGYHLMFTLDNDGNLADFPLQSTGYVHNRYGMTYFTLADQPSRDGNAIIMPMYLAFFKPNGQLGAMDMNNEVIEFPGN